MMNEKPDLPEQPIEPNMQYEFRVNGRLTQEMQIWFDDMTLTIDDTTSHPQTIIRGTIRDQSALYGLVTRIRDLGLTLLSINPVHNKENYK